MSADLILMWTLVLEVSECYFSKGNRNVANYFN